MNCPDCGREMGKVLDTGEAVCQWCVNDKNVEMKKEHLAKLKRRREP